MNGRRWLLAMTMLAAVTTLGQAQGRGGPPPEPPTPPAGRGRILTPEQRGSIQKLRQQQRQEMLDLRTRQRDQLNKALPPDARARVEQRQRRLMRDGRQFERMQRGRGGMQACAPQGGGGRGRGGNMQGPQRGMGPGCMGPGNRNMMQQNGAGPGRGGMRGRGGMQPPPPPPAI